MKNSFIPVTGLTSGIDPSSPIEITADGIDDYSAIILGSIHKLPQIMKRGGGAGGVRPREKAWDRAGGGGGPVTTSKNVLYL